MITKIKQYSDIIPGQVYTNGRNARTVVHTERESIQLHGRHTVDYKTIEGMFAPSPINARSFKAWVNNKKNLPQKIWANSVNLNGIGADVPVLCIFNEDSGAWWSTCENFDVLKLGHCDTGTIITFASINEYDVLCWMDGVIAIMKMVGRWSNTGSKVPPL